MGKIKGLIIFILFVVAVVTGFFYRNEIFNFFDKNAQDFQKSEVGNLISKTAKQIISPPPLQIGGTKNAEVLLKSKVIEETNLARYRDANMPPLKENKILDQAAAAKAQDILKNQYFEHVSPSGVGPGELVQNFGYDYIMAGENLILGNFSSEEEIVNSWMDSPGHRANILNNRYTEIGVAIIKGNYKGETVWVGVQEFGLPLSVCQQPNEALKNQIDYQKQQLDILATELDQKKNKVNRQNVDEYNQLVMQYNSLAEQTKENILIYNNQVNIFNDCVSGK